MFSRLYESSKLPVRQQHLLRLIVEHEEGKIKKISKQTEN